MSNCDDTLPTGEPAICVAARSLVGLAYPDQRYLDAIAPGRTPAVQAQMGRLSGCALLWLAENGVEWTGDAFADMWRALKHSPWARGGRVRVPGGYDQPQPGEAVVYGPSAAEPYAHVDYCWLGGGQAVAAGQRDAAGNECIALVTRDLRWAGGKLVDETTGRPVIAIIAGP